MWHVGMLQAEAASIEGAAKATNGTGSSSKAAAAGPSEQQAMEGDQEEVRWDGLPSAATLHTSVPVRFCSQSQAPLQCCLCVSATLDN
jgi:hypothetical protein